MEEYKKEAFDYFEEGDLQTKYQEIRLNIMYNQPEITRTNLINQAWRYFTKYINDKVFAFIIESKYTILDNK